MKIQKRKFVFSRSYRRKCLANGIEFVKKSQLNRRTSEIKMVDGYIGKIKEFPTSADSIVQFKEAMDNVDRGGDPVTQGLKIWDAGKTSAQTINVLDETSLATHALGKSIVEWEKGH